MEDTALWMHCTDSLRMRLEALARLERRNLENQLISLIDTGLRVFESRAVQAGEQETVP